MVMIRVQAWIWLNRESLSDYPFTPPIVKPPVI